jgi:hypothetical protein
MSFGTVGTEEGKQGPIPFITPGIQEVSIVSVTGEVNKNDNPFITINFKIKESDGKFTTGIRMFFSEKAAPYSKANLLHITNRVVDRALIDSITSPTIVEYGEALSSVLAGTELRMKFQGEEYAKADGSIGTRSVLGFPDFAESLKVAADKTGLVFDANQDIKKLAAQPSVEESIDAALPMPGMIAEESAPFPAGEEGDDLPY